MSNRADIYVYDGGRYHEVVINGETFQVNEPSGHDIHPVDWLLEVYSISDIRWRNSCPPGFWGDYTRGCKRHKRPVPASLDRPCCESAAEEIYIWWDEIRDSLKEDTQA